MSLLFYAPKKLITKSKRHEATTSSIVLASVVILVGIIILMYSGLMYTETTMKQYSDCRDKIIGFYHQGMYPSQELFKVALSHCDDR